MIIQDRAEIMAKKPNDFEEILRCKKKTKRECPFCKIKEEASRIVYEGSLYIVKNKYPFIEESYVFVHKNHYDGFEREGFAKEFGEGVGFAKKLAKEKGKFPLIFKNHGFFAGASLEHAHEQAILINPEDKPKYHKMMEFIEEELKSPRAINEFSFCPRASLEPYECWVVVEEKWERISKVFKLLKKALGEFDYNLILHTGEFPNIAQIIPRKQPPSGIELALARFTNPFPPEKVASHLREFLD